MRGGTLKLDLHTHCLEATHFARPTVDVVGQIVERVKAQGLDGIGITDHLEKNYALQVAEIVHEHFNNEILIIPGQELDRVYYHMVELYLPGDCVFRFVAHPGYPSSRWAEYLDDIHGLEIENGNWGVARQKVRQVAEEKGLLLLSNSDAHSLYQIGKHSNEVDLDDLCARAREAR